MKHSQSPYPLPPLSFHFYEVTVIFLVYPCVFHSNPSLISCNLLSLSHCNLHIRWRCNLLWFLDICLTVSLFIQLFISSKGRGLLICLVSFCSCYPDCKRWLLSLSCGFSPPMAPFRPVLPTRWSLCGGGEGVGSELTVPPICDLNQMNPHASAPHWESLAPLGTPAHYSPVYESSLLNKY